ncbi:hypothetical protein FNF27_08030 [Cafeteria roenbergensis]|uniref:Uncharacterized protein n=1 Tax=Cafeteria roenbergensis TaxID=33653 RepID=A0A5A8DFQ3_CAFRO|nr:hypothetical protein FNF28_07537 [Cafeteria roenbergensis]KAA0149685.1 hypothetical protein FNF31_07180 [Cafeteria roenbergensis]KAA0162691.1 hypothetical protein FNF27_08030 [Cafeteria roenbergensis]
MADAKRGAKEPMSELTFVETWRQRIDSEISSQVRFASEWGSLESDSSRLPETLEEQIEQKRAEIAALRARLGSDAAALSTTTGAMQRPADTTLEKLTPFETELDKKLKTVAGTHTRRGATRGAKPAPKR